MNAKTEQNPENIRLGAPYDDLAFESLCREHSIWGTASAALCAVFWRRAEAAMAESVGAGGVSALMPAMPERQGDRAMPVIAYLRATPDGEAVWRDDCVYPDPVYPSDPDGSDADDVSMPMVRQADALAALADLAALDGELARVRDAFGVPKKGSELEHAWAAAMSQPDCVAGYVLACVAEKDAEIAALKAERDNALLDVVRLAAEKHVLRKDAKLFAESNIALRGEIAALKPDAERYHWLARYLPSDDVAHEDASVRAVEKHHGIGEV